jgi:glycerophosphoryl diester phosphodiesterase
VKRLALFPERRRPLLFAHRGASSLIPENTLASYRKARELGAPGIELDLHLSADGKFVLAHDAGFERTSPAWSSENPGRCIEDMQWEDIKQIDIGSFFDGRFKAERPQLLEDIIEEFCPAMYLDIELKTTAATKKSLPRSLAAFLKTQRKEVQLALSISSFSPTALSVFKAALPSIPTAFIYDKAAFLRRFTSCDYLKPQVRLMAQAGRARFTEGRPFVAWTIDSKEDAQEALLTGAAGIITNRIQDFAGR